MFNYGDRIEYIDGTRDLNFEAAQQWAIDNDTSFEEDLEARELPKRVFVIGDAPEVYEPTYEEKYEEVRKTREALYRDQKDPITCQIQSLRDEEQTDEILAEIENLLVKRQTVVASIKAANPYPVAEEPSEVLELYSMEV